MPNTDGTLTGADVRAGITQADDIMHQVRGELSGLAKEIRWQGLEGPDREEFFRGMSKDEFDTLKDIAFAMGPKGTAKLERLLNEAMGVRGVE